MSGWRPWSEGASEACAHACALEGVRCARVRMVRCARMSGGASRAYAGGRALVCRLSVPARACLPRKARAPRYRGRGVKWSTGPLDLIPTSTCPPPTRPRLGRRGQQQQQRRHNPRLVSKRRAAAQAHAGQDRAHLQEEHAQLARPQVLHLRPAPPRPAPPRPAPPHPATPRALSHKCGGAAGRRAAPGPAAGCACARRAAASEHGTRIRTSA
jgi:hypothetical protein